MRLRHLAAAVLATSVLAVPAEADPVEDAGVWTTTQPGSPFSGSVAVFRDGTAYAFVNPLSKETGLAKSSDFGRTWTAMDPPPVGFSPEWGSPTTGYAVDGYECGASYCIEDVFVTTDAARSWRRAAALPARPRGTIRFFASGYATTGRGRSFYLPVTTRRAALPHCRNHLTWGYWDIVVTRDTGRSWRAYRLPAQGTVLHIDMFDDRHGVLAMDEVEPADPEGCAGPSDATRSAVWMTNDGARTWRRIHTCAGQCWNVAIGSPDDVYVAEQDAVVQVSHDGGRSFRASRLVPSVLPSTEAAIVFDVDFATPRTGYAITYGLGIYRTTDGGATWLPEPSPVQAPMPGWYRITAADARHALALWPGGVLTRVTTDVGR